MFKLWRVILPLPLPAIDYQPPHDFTEDPVGHRVLVPWHEDVLVGILAEVAADGAEHHLKEAIAVIDHEPLLTSDGLATLQWISDYTLTPIGRCLSDFLPFGLEPKLEHLVRLVDGVDSMALPPGAEDLFDWRAVHDKKLVALLRSLGLLLEKVRLIKPQEQVLVLATDLADDLSPKQSQVLSTLKTLGQVQSAAELARQASVSSGVVTALIKKGIIQQKNIPKEIKLINPITNQINPSEIDLPMDSVHLHGGRANDRYSVLTKLIKENVTLYVAPDRFRLERAWTALGGPDAVLLDMDRNENERELIWKRAKQGEIKAVFTTPLGLLIPLSGLSLIIIEEEGSDAYKLIKGSRVFIPDAAKKRAELAKARLILTGSAPSVESMLYPGIALSAPKVRKDVVDYANSRESWPISIELERLLRQVAERGRQAVVIAPRRGYSAILRCQDCGWLPGCPNCDVGLRWHAQDRQLRCHQCGFVQRPPDRCPNCQGVVFSPRGPGSEWIGNELKKIKIPIYRFDRDQRDDLSEIDRGQPGIVVGTTALLGRPAPPNLALIALSFADIFLARSDFRAAERYHSVLRQLIEWHPTRAPILLIQTFQGNHPVLDLEKPVDVYPTSELQARKMFFYPPFSLLAQIQIAAKAPELSLQTAEALAKDLRETFKEEILGPAPAPIAKLRGMFLQQILVRSTEGDLNRILQIAKNWRGPAKVRIDVNPRDLSGLLGD